MFVKIVKNVGMLAFLTVLVMVGFGASVCGYVLWQVKYGDFTKLKKSTILAMFQEETSLFYDDEKTRIGSIFESRHRRYVPIDEIPVFLINAVVAVEDKNFYRHFGVDPLAIGSAIMEGLSKKGQFRRGGSTITQQTVKNIINDWEPSFARKFREMIRAIQLERIYDKRQILEFYLNQFHVVGNGNGIDVAARYYFDKDVKSLSLVESAFIAGSVKGPGKYNPFIKYSRDEQDNSKQYANDRKNYVLSQMVEQLWISKEEYEEAVKTDVPFKRGEFRTAEVSLVELIQSQLEKKEILTALGLTKPEDLSISGLKVFTTIDGEFQRAAQLSMRRNLSRLETILTGFAPEKPETFKVLRDLKPEDFVYGKVTAIQGHSPADTSIKVTFGIPNGVITNESLVRYAKILNLVDGKGYQFYLQHLLKTIKVGDVLFMQVSSYDKESNEAVVELHKRPTVSGGLIALDKGEVRAIVSGFDTLGYNRAVTAKRQPGSVFKSLVYFAALQLGWSVLDSIDNIRQVFPFQSRNYFPRPDHKPIHESVSMIWAGIKSENLASVSLTAHLLDKLNFDQFKQLMNTMGYSPLANEVPRDYHYRVAKETGVSLDYEGIVSYQVTRAVNDLSADLVFSGDELLLKKLKLMSWGSGYESRLKVIRLAGSGDVNLKERKIRHELIANNYLRMKEINTNLTRDWKIIKMSVDNVGLAASFQDPSLHSFFNKFRVISEGPLPQIAYFMKLPDEESIPNSSHFPLPDITGRHLELKDLEAWNTNIVEALDNVKIDGSVPRKILIRMDQIIDKNLAEIKKTDEDPYRLYSYFQHHDFRIGLGLKYLVRLAQAVGVQNRLEGVLSFPLGTNDVTTGEVAKIYQTFMAGKVYRFFEEGPANQISFVKRIEDRFGNVLFKADRKESQLVDPFVAQQVREILKQVVAHGTGRRAYSELYVNEQDKNGTTDPTVAGAKAHKNEFQVRVPSFGKTGTTNDFTTSYFAGFMPYPTEKYKPLNPENSYTVATYVGYDMNKIMKKGMQRIYGGVGALPVWTDFLKEVIKIKQYADYIDPSVRGEWPMIREEKTGQFLVDLPQGVVLRSGSGSNSEEWKATNMSVTGEEFVKDDAPDVLTSAILSLSPDPTISSIQPKRIFSTFRLANGNDFTKAD